MHLTHLDLFAGVGMFSLAARWAGIETVAFAEIHPYANAVLAHRFPHLTNLGDVRKLCRRIADNEITHDASGAADLDAGVHCPLCDADFADCDCIGADAFTDEYGFPAIISAGFPCQDVSVGSHTGTGINGQRSGQFWESLRITRELRPTFLLLENVPALRTRGADAILEALGTEGYAAESFVVGANALGGGHRRKRVWIAAYDTTVGIQGLRPEGQQEPRALGEPLLPLRDCNGQWQVEPDLRRAPDGDARWMDRVACIGNAVVPQIPVHFFDWMRQVTHAEPYKNPK